jgi:hypothetical protein
VTKFKEITHSEFKQLRYDQWIKQKRICPILKREIEYKKAVFDHKHRTKTETIGEKGKGLLRGVIHFQANIIEGKIVKLYKRYGLHKFIALPELLRNIADYIENPPMKPEYIHPNERSKPKKLGKRDFNRICKYYFQIYPKRRKLPVYPESGRMNNEFKLILEKINKLCEEKEYAKRHK